MTEEKTSMVDALIQNPFGEDVVKNTSLQDVSADFPTRTSGTTKGFGGFIARETTRTSSSFSETN